MFSSQSYGSSKYEPRYQVGDLIRNGLGAVRRISVINRATPADGVSGPWAIRVGAVSYELESLDGSGRAVMSTDSVHQMIDERFSQWAYLGPASEAVGDATGGAS